MRYIRHESLLLLAGDVVVFYMALWLTLCLRYLELPDYELWASHATPFTALLFVSVAVYFIAGLYDQHTLFLRERVPVLVSVSQGVTAVAGALLFFLIPYFGITPKTNLLIFLVLSSLGGIAWRFVWARMPRGKKKTRALILGGGADIDALAQELHHNSRYRVAVVEHIAPSDVVVSEDLEAQLHAYIRQKNIAIIIADTRNPAMHPITPILYNLLFIHPDLVILDALSLYERIFRRIPISVLERGWFVAYGAVGGEGAVYAFLRRVFDVCMGVLVWFVYIIVFPFVWYAIRREDGGTLFIEQERIGERGATIRMRKFRSMTGSDVGGQVLQSALRVTRVGAFLRTTRIDELPQYTSLLRGELSFIGPRPELPALAELYAKEIPYYHARHLVRPGLTGWAQLYHDAHPHHGADIEETRNKLSYDLYYLKHRSFLLDFEIAVKTVKKIVTRSGK